MAEINIGSKPQETLAGLHRRGYQIHVRKDGTFYYTKVKGTPKKPPRFSRAQLARAQAEVDAGVKLGVAATNLGVSTSTTLRAWL